MDHRNTMPGKRFAVMPVVAIDRVQYRRALMMCAGQRDKDTVIAMETIKLRIIRKVGIISLPHGMGREGNSGDAVLSIAVVHQPFEEQITHARLPRER
jgi:hypothetical protein